jgi:hypothetical protein
MDVSRCRTTDCSTHIAGEGMKEDAVLIILEVSINLVFPKFTTGANEVNEAEEMSTSATVCYQ